MKVLRGGPKDLDRQLIADICAGEGCWEEVMAIARHEAERASMFLNVLDEYEEELAKRYPQEVSTILAERAEAFAGTTDPKKNDYVQAVRLLKRVKKMGAAQLADALAADWSERLKRRKGLMTELEKL